MVSDALTPYPVPRAEHGEVGCVCICALEGKGQAWAEGGWWVTMLISRPTASSPGLKPSCSNASNVGAGVPKPPVSFTYASLEPAAQQPGLVQHRRPSPKQPPFLCPTMALGFMVLLLAGAVGTASRAQPVLTQPPAVSVLPGQTARLSCTLSPQYNISHFGISWWYQQHPGQSLRYLLYYNSEQDKHKPANIPDRFSATKDLARNACILIIASARNEDNGSYYCSLSQVFKWF
nr:pre-B lymphocyte protein 3 [Columba livia]